MCLLSICGSVNSLLQIEHGYFFARPLWSRPVAGIGGGVVRKLLAYAVDDRDEERIG